MARPRQVSDEQILEAMRDRVLAGGPNVSLEQVASALDVSVPALLKRFGSRQALMLAALRPPPVPEWVEKVAKGPDDRPLEEQLFDIFTLISEFMSAAMPCMTALRESGIPLRELFPKEGGPLLGLKTLQRWLALAKKKGLVTAEETDAAGYALLGSLQTRSFFSHLLMMEFSARDQRKYLKELAALFARALNP